MQYKYHRSHHKHLKRGKRIYKRLMATLAGAAIMSSTALAAFPATVHAAPDPAVKAAPVAQLQDTMQEKQAKTPDKYERVLNIKATAYAPGPADNDQWGDKTYLGTTVRPGIIAVDPKIIPLGSRVYIKYPDGRGQYAVAEDTGGAIKGQRIDIAMSTRSQAKKFGIKPVKVYVLSSPEKPPKQVV